MRRLPRRWSPIWWPPGSRQLRTRGPSSSTVGNKRNWTSAGSRSVSGSRFVRFPSGSRPSAKHQNEEWSCIATMESAPFMRPIFSGTRESQEHFPSVVASVFGRQRSIRIFQDTEAGLQTQNILDQIIELLFGKMIHLAMEKFFVIAGKQVAQGI